MLTGNVPPGEMSIAFPQRSLSAAMQSASFMLLHIEGQKPSGLVRSHGRSTEVHFSSQPAALPGSNVLTKSASEKQLVAVGQLPSHISGGSVTLLPHTGEQLLSLSALQPDGQQLSLLMQPVAIMLPPSGPPGALRIGLGTRCLAGCEADTPGWGTSSDRRDPRPRRSLEARRARPTRRRRCRRRGGGLWLFALHPDAQHPSPFVQVVMVPEGTHCRWQPVPWSAYAVQPMFAHEVGQFPSRISPDSTTLLPQEGRQLLSFSELHVPPGQQLSLLMHAVCVPVSWQAAWQVPPFTSARSVHMFCGHVIGQVESGSHVSPDSTIPLPQLTGQSTSRLASDVLQPVGQQLSGIVPLHATGVEVHLALHVAAEPVYVTTWHENRRACRGTARWRVARLARRRVDEAVAASRAVRIVARRASHRAALIFARVRAGFRRVTAHEVARRGAARLRVGRAAVRVVAVRTRAGRVAGFRPLETPVAAPRAVRVGHRRAAGGAAAVVVRAACDGAAVDALALAAGPLEHADRAPPGSATWGTSSPRTARPARARRCRTRPSSCCRSRRCTTSGSRRRRSRSSSACRTSGTAPGTCRRPRANGACTCGRSWDTTERIGTSRRRRRSRCRTARGSRRRGSRGTCCNLAGSIRRSSCRCTGAAWSSNGRCKCSVTR